MTVAEVLPPLCPQIPMSKPKDLSLGTVPGLWGSVMGFRGRLWGQGPQDVIGALVSRDPKSSPHTLPPAQHVRTREKVTTVWGHGKRVLTRNPPCGHLGLGP